MSRSDRTPGPLGLAAVLLPSALALHELVYATTGEAAATAAQHGYLAQALPLIAAAAGSLAVAAVLLPALGLGGRVGGERARMRPFSIALALVVLFGVQESIEAFALGGGAGQLASAFAAGWLLLPAAIALGAAGAAAIEWLERAGQGLARLLAGRPARARRRRGRACVPRPAALACHRLLPLEFGLARRPPPLAG